MSVTINEGLIWLKTLRARHSELVQLRNQNSQDETRYYGANADKMSEKKPTYDVKQLDKLITTVAGEIRRLEMRIKSTNATATLGDYAIDEAVLGQVQ